MSAVEREHEQCVQTFNESKVESLPKLSDLSVRIQLAASTNPFQEQNTAPPRHRVSHSEKHCVSFQHVEPGI